MARDILAVQAAGVSIEQEFSIASSFTQDNRTYSTSTLSALMVCNHSQFESDRQDQIRYYLHLRVEEVEEDEYLIEKLEQEEEDFIQDLQQSYISDGEDSSDSENELSSEDKQP